MQVVVGDLVVYKDSACDILTPRSRKVVGIVLRDHDIRTVLVLWSDCRRPWREEKSTLRPFVRIEKVKL